MSSIGLNHTLQNRPLIQLKKSYSKPPHSKEILDKLNKLQEKIP